MGFEGWTTALISAAGCLLAGLALRAGGVRGWRCLRYALGFGPGLGLGLASLTLFYCHLLGLGRPGPGRLALVFAALSAGAAAWARFRGDAAAGPRSAPGSRPPLVLRAAALLALLVTAAGVPVSYWIFSRSWPDGTWDAVAVWNVRAHFLERGYEQAPDLLKQVDLSSHPGYPLLLPGAVASQLALDNDERVPEATGLAFLVGVGLLAFAVVADSGLLSYAALATALLWGTPTLIKWGGAQVADVPLAGFFLGAVATLASQLPGREGTRLPPLLGGVFLGLLAWTKDEGALIALLLLGLYALWTLLFVPGGRERWRPLASFALGSLPGLAAFFLFKGFWAPRSAAALWLQGGLLERALTPERWWLPVKSILLRLVPIRDGFDWGPVWPALVLGILLACWIHWRARRPWASFWGATLLGSVLSWLPVYVLTPYDQEWHISGSLDRLLLQLFPALVAGLFLRFAIAVGSTEKSEALYRLPPLLPMPVFLAAVIAATLGAKIVAVLLAVPSIWLMPDELLYTMTAYDLVHWGGGGIGVPHPDFLYYPPLTSLLIAPLHGLGLSPPVVYRLSLLLFNVLLSSTVVAAYLLLARLFGTRSRLLPVLVALGTPCMALILMSEPPFVTLFAWFLYFYVRMVQERRVSDAVWAGLLLAGLVLTRPVGPLVAGALLAGALVDLGRGGPEVRRKLRLYAWTLALPLVAAVAWKLAAGVLRGGEGGGSLNFFLTVGLVTPVKMVLGSARRFASELGYVSLSTFGFALPAVLWRLFRRGPEEDRRGLRPFLAVVLGFMVLASAMAGVFMWYSRFHYLPRYDMYGRYVDYFAIPLLAVALGTFQQMRQGASARERWALAGATLLLNAAFLVVIPERFFPESLKGQVAPNSLSISWLLSLTERFGPGVRWLLPPVAALAAALLTSPAYRFRRVRYALAAGLIALAAFNLVAAARAVSVQSHGSQQHASRISDYVAANPGLFADGLYVDYPGIGHRRGDLVPKDSQHAFAFRVVADHVDKVVVGFEPERFLGRMPVLSMRPFPGRQVLAEWPWIEYRIYAADPAEPSGPVNSGR